MEQFANGPYLQAAFFCERLLEESDGVLSAIRIVDTIDIQDGGLSEQTEPPLVNLILFIAFKGGGASGSYDLTVTMEGPSQNPTTAEERYTQTLVFYGTEDRGVTVIMPVAMTVGEEGVYWFTIYLSGRLVTRLPLRVAVVREMPPDGPQ
jgi:hypothetical protein